MRHLMNLKAAVVGGLLLGATAAQAEPVTWVSATGTDANTCDIAAPCRTLRHALTKTDAGGTIGIASSGNFAGVNLTKPVSIVAEGVQAVINSAAGCGAAICVNAGSGAVTLRGITIDLPFGGMPNAGHGILFFSGAALYVEKTHIGESGIQKFGIGFLPSAPAYLRISDTVITNSGEGISIAPRGGTATVVLNRVQVKGILHNVTFEGQFGGAIQATITNSTISNAVGAGLLVIGPGSIDVMVDRSNIVNNAYATEFRDGANNTRLRVGDSTIAGFDYHTFLDSLLSYGSNEIDRPVSVEKIPYK